MNTYKTYVQIDDSGRLVLEGLPFPVGTLVEVLLVDQSRGPEERRESWQALMRHVQELPSSRSISDEEIEAEILAHRNRS